MARRKPDSRDKPSRKSSRKSRRRPWWLGLLRFIFRPPVLYLILVGIVAALLYWRREIVVWWTLGIVSQALGMFGWGLVLMAIAVVALAWVAVQRKLSSFVYRGNRWLGGIAFALTAWGILAFLGLGGSFGLSIIGYPSYRFTSILAGAGRLLALVIIGILLVAPRTSFRSLAKSFSWLGRQLPKRPIPRPARQRKPSLPSVPLTRGPVTPSTLVPKAVELEPEVERELERERKAVRAASVAPSQQELKQVAQEVWKKYGESPDLVIVDGWRLPPIDILDRSAEAQFSQADNVKRAKLIEDSLASYGVEAKVVQINEGPTVTQFGVEPGWDRKVKEVKEKDRDGTVRIRVEEVAKTRVKVERISSLGNDLALALAASSIRIEAPVPGKSIVGIEVPNVVTSLVSLRGVIETSVFQKMLAKSRLSAALGKGAGGEGVAADLGKMPHLLIAGATGSGKTVCLNSIICCLLLYNTPNDVRFIMVDPKRVELTIYNSIPHLATPVIVDTNKALGTLRWLGQEMDRRYRELATAGVRNIEGYNKGRRGEDRMPYLVLVIDELADLMMGLGDEVEHILCRLAQLSRAVGIHLVVATQRPSVDVVTGLIKANFPTRISFAVTSQVDSRTILDSGGAEKLLGKGDMLYMPTEAAKPKRLQGCYVSDAEAERLVYFWGGQKKEGIAELKVEELVPSRPAATGREYPEDSLLEAARQLVEEHKHVSTSFLQRKLRIGYPRAARIMEQLEVDMAQEEGEEKGE